MKNNWAGRLTKVHISKLKLHPTHERFPPLADAKFEQIKRSIDKCGLKNPLQATSQFVVIDGRHRLRAVTELGWTEIDVLIRKDLDGQGEQAILRELFAANSERRQQSLLEQVEVLLELQKEDPDLDIAAVCNASERQVRNLKQIVNGPPALLTAVKTCVISEASALRILKLDSKKQAKCLAVIAGGENVKTALRDLLASFAARSPKPLAALNDQLEDLKQQLEALPVGVALTKDQHAALTTFVAQLDHWLEATRPLKLKLKA